MSTSERRNKALQVINEQLQQLSSLMGRPTVEENIHLRFEQLNRWKERTVALLAQHVSQTEASKLENRRLGSFSMMSPLRNFDDEGTLYRGFLKVLAEELQTHPDQVLARSAKDTGVEAVPVPGPTASRTVFIIHGRDELNLLRLEKVLRDQWKLKSIVMRDKPGKSRTLIEKFEEEAMAATFAIALFSPDDFVRGQQGEYLQARPNVIFELGWFCGRLGRERVCILLKKGTVMHPANLDTQGLGF